MERYFPKVAKTSNPPSLAVERVRYHPYKSQPQPLDKNKELNDKSNLEQFAQIIKGDQVQQPKCRLSTKELNQGLLRNLKSEHNPITHSNAASRADRVFSVSTGHQRNEERVNRRLYLEDRERKSVAQQGPISCSNGVLRSVRIYLSGYLDGTTDIEMKRIVAEAGGQTVLVPSQCTHIVTSQWLSGSKTDRFLKAKTRNKPYIVHPEWVFQSITQGKRQPERKYTICIDNTHKSLM